MKFARYLQETQTPEWKKAYIDYHGLKKRIKEIRRTQEGLESTYSSLEEDEDSETAGEYREADIVVASPNEEIAHQAPTLPPLDLADPPKQLHVEFEDPTGFNPQAHIGKYSRDYVRSATGRQSVESTESTEVPSVRSFLNSQGEPNVLVRTEPSSRRQSLARRLTAPLFRRTSTPHNVADEPAPLVSPQMPLHVMLPKLFCTPDRTSTGTTFTTNYGTINAAYTSDPIGGDEPTYNIANAHKKFFACLDAELEKVDHFYIDRELEMQARGKVLKEQLEELGDHHRIFHAAHSNDAVWPQKLAASLLDPIMGLFLNEEGKANKAQAQKAAATKEKESRKAKRPISSPKLTSLGVPGTPPTASFEEGERLMRERDASTSPSRTSRFEPDDYLHAKKKLQKAVLEHYRGLETLNNFRVLNMTGFRKALKKYQKVTKIPAQMAYLKEKVDTSSFANGESVTAMINETEGLFATRFAKGDKKTAMARLRTGGKQKSHHFSTFRTGMMLGLSIPPTVAGIYYSFQEDTREDMPGWDALLTIYATFLIPVLFSLLFGLNLLVWAQSRINYVFIFELKVRTRMDYREYFEMPSLLIMSLAYAFWLSFAMIGPPTLWPIVWFCFAAAVMVQPFNWFFHSSRFWLIKKVGKLLLSGLYRVEFSDFFLGDQLCSLVFSLANLYSVACTYHAGFDHLYVWKKCGPQSSHWGFILLFATLPLLTRFVQSIRRFWDSQLVTHLVNAAKYAAGLIYYSTYYYWQHQGKPQGPSFIAYCLCGVFYSIFACAWDFLMDWSLLRPHARYTLLRPELAYSNHISLYYLAMVQNIILRFVWTIHIIMPHRGLDPTVRSFIAAVLEVVRRIIWNFYRLENEHMGNMDQYRITREVPLPYTIEDRVEEDEDDEVGRDGMPKKSPREWLKKNLFFRGRRSRGDDGGERQTET